MVKKGIIKPKFTLYDKIIMRLQDVTDFHDVFFSFVLEKLICFIGYDS